MTKRDHWRYELRNGHEIVYVGITYDPERREGEHRSKEKQFTKMDIIGPAVTKKTAEQWENERLKTYQRSHKGKNPRYNKTEK